MSKKPALGKEIEFELLNGDKMEIRILHNELIAGYLSNVSMQWPLNGARIRVYSPDVETMACLQFWHNDGVTYHNFHFKKEHVKNVVAFLKSWGFDNCER